MVKRLITGTILIAVILPFLIFPQLEIGFEILMFAGALIGTWELLRMYGKDGKFSYLQKGVVYVSTALIYLAILALDISGNTSSKLLPVHPVTGVAMLLIAFVLDLSLLVFSASWDARKVGVATFISFYLGFGCGALASLRVMGSRFIVYLFAMTMFTDIFAYVYGMLFGKHKMAPNISPKKSWEGAIAGSICAVTFATLFAYNYGMLFEGVKGTLFDTLGAKNGGMTFADLNEVVKIIIIVVVSILGSIAGQLGDLVASKLKRTYDIKDYSNIFPGHGGFLDRFDSAVYASMLIVALFVFITCILGVI